MAAAHVNFSAGADDVRRRAGQVGRHDVSRSGQDVSRKVRASAARWSRTRNAVSETNASPRPASAASSVRRVNGAMRKHADLRGSQAATAPKTNAIGPAPKGRLAIVEEASDQPRGDGPGAVVAMSEDICRASFVARRAGSAASPHHHPTQVSRPRSISVIVRNSALGDARDSLRVSRSARPARR